jgi:ABC-type iron transport system FetAB ATPase subunit
LYGHPIYNMTSPRSTAITSKAAALDAQTCANMQNLLLNVLATEGKTVMLITHSVEEAIYHDGDGPPRWISFTVAYGRYSILRERVSCTVHDGNRGQ